MSFVPHTEEDVEVMLDAVGIKSVDDLFSSVPTELRLDQILDGVPGSLSEPELVSEFSALAGKNRFELVCFAGGGAYDSFIPAAVKSLAARGEFATSYTPYQPEVSQGVLQALFEYQTLICRLTGMEVANASLYDGATALVEAVNLAVSVTGRSRVLVSAGVNPRYRQVLSTLAAGTGHRVETEQLADGVTAFPAAGEEVSALVVQHPNYLGAIEDVEAVSMNAASAGALTIVVTDPIACGVLKRPGDMGADVVVGEGQALGSPLNFGGPYLGLFATRNEYLRAVPGRISGETLDLDGRRSYALALQGREQHIRREKASSNICTNQTLMAIGAAISLCWLGPEGLRHSARNAALKAHYLSDLLRSIPGCEPATRAPFLREFALRVPRPAAGVLSGLADHGFLGGIDLGEHYPELGDAILVAVTEQRTRHEMDRYADSMEKVIEKC